MLPLDVDAKRAKQFVMDMFDLNECICERVIPRYPEKSTFASYKIRVDASRSESFIMPDRWPTGIALSQWFITGKLREPTTP